MKRSEILQKRKEHHQEICEALTDQDYTPEDATVSVVKANVMAFVTTIPFLIVLIPIFMLLHSGEAKGQEFMQVFTFPRSLWMLAGMFLSVPIHEFLHGFGWHFFCQNQWKSIQFGVMWEVLTPYCYCGEALNLSQYYIGLLMPCMILGVVISLIGIITGSMFWFVTGIYNIILAGGDLTIGCILFKYIRNKSEKKILDHPSECGCTAFLKK